MSDRQKIEDMTKEINKLQVETKRHRVSIIEIEKQRCERSLIIQGMPMIDGGRSERPDQTLRMLWKEFLPHFEVDENSCWIESAVRLGTYDKDKKEIPAIKLTFVTPECRHMILRALPNLRGVEGADEWSINVELPLLLRPEADRARSVAWLWRQENGKRSKTEIKTRGQGLVVYCKKEGRDQKFTPMSDREFRDLYERYKKKGGKQGKKKA